MDSLLHPLRRLEDLQSLVRHFGHSPELRRLPPDGWTGSGEVARAAVVGRHDGFEWLGFETSSPPAPVASGLARRLERTARLTGIMVLAPATRTLALSVSFAPRPVLVVDLDHPTPLAQAALQRLAGDAIGAGSLDTAARVARGLDTEAVGRRFFGDFRHSLDRMAGALPARIPADDRQSLALLQLTRVLFLYFVQAKGWLDGRPAFLREEVDRVLGSGRDLQGALLRPLFFGTLNQPGRRRGREARSFGAMPFLNGGLFEPHPLERLWRSGVPNAVWRDTFDGLFERYHFTTGTADGRVIAPDMLGRVFEGVMHPEERGASGTYFTPAALVAPLVRATLAAHLAQGLGCGDAEAERRLLNPDPAAAGLLDQITILDPAVGSGAFLLGALEVLSAGRPGPTATVRRRILTRSLFGVDLNPAAVRLTELRLWLALIAEDGAEDPAEVAPLPNLDSLIRQGDSLVEPLAARWRGRVPREATLRLTLLREEAVLASGPAKAAVFRRLRAAERDLAATILADADEGLRGRIRDLTECSRSVTLFGTPRGLTQTERRTLESLRGERRFLWTVRRRLDRDGTLPWFHYQSQFADVVVERRGFDVVLGNPPWVRAEALPASLRGYLKGRYEWWEAHGHGFAHQPDLSVAFVERGLELVRPGGTLGYLVPAKLATAGYATTARRALATRESLHCVADLTGDPRAGFDATVYPMAVIVTRTPPSPSRRVRLTLDPGGRSTVPQGLLGGAPWILSPDRSASALRRLRTAHPAVQERFRCHLGVKTGLNGVFLDPVGPVEPELLRWAVRGRDIRPFAVCPSSRLLWTHGGGGEPLAALPPAAAAYLALHRPALRARRDWTGGPDWLLFRTGPALAPHRVTWSDLALRLEAAPLTGPSAEELIPLNSCYVVPVPDRATALRLSAWLNCTWLRAAAALVADAASGGYRRFNARTVGSLPLPPEVLSDDTLLRLASHAMAGTLGQDDLDEACNAHLHLTREDREALAAVVPPRRGGGR